MQPHSMSLRSFFDDFVEPFAYDAFSAFDTCHARVDVKQLENGNTELTVDLPGVAKEDVKVEVQGRELHIEGKLPKPEKEDSGRTAMVWRERCRGGRLHRRIPFPYPIDPSSVSANYLDGLLKVHVTERHPITSRTNVQIS